MTRTDFLLMKHHSHKEIEMLSGDVKSKLLLHDTVDKFHDALDKFWCDMLDLNDVIKKVDSNDDGIVKILKQMREKMAYNFEEKGYFKDGQ